ncbi:MAG: tRNA pseudouridine(54/55) synthase Pus10 [Candidatus Bathyarchaeia archaeon]
MKRETEILEKAEEMLKKYTLCDCCLGRQFALLGYGLNNRERGSAIKTLLLMKADQLASVGDEGGVELLKTLSTKGLSKAAEDTLQKWGEKRESSEVCYLCEGKFNLLDEVTEKAVEELKEYEFKTFLVGIDLPKEVEEREDELKAEFKVEYGENMRNELSREIGKKISSLLFKQVDYKRPEVTVLINPMEGRVEVQPNPLFVSGRYRKLKRGIPQTRWLCPKCRGKGCKECEGTGKLYPESVEELISRPILETTLGSEALMHAAGREDIDALMLGDGRPFVIEVKKPRRRYLNLEELTKRINELAKGRVEVLNLKLTDKTAVKGSKKGESYKKVYRVVAKFKEEVTDEELKSLEKAFDGA